MNNLETVKYYDTVKERIADYIVRQPVEETEEVISAYTLFSILENQNKRLRHVKEMEKALLDKLNTIYPQCVIKKKGKFFKKKTKQDYFDEIFHIIKDDGSFLSLSSTDRWHCIMINKDFGYEDIYSEDKTDVLTEEAYNECEYDIKAIFKELEYVGVPFAEEKKNNCDINSKVTKHSILQAISCEGFNIGIKYDRYDNMFYYDIYLNKGFDPNGNSNNHYYNQENNLNHIIEENKEDILRNIPVHIKDLSYMFCMLVLDYRSNQERKEYKEETEKQVKKIMNEIKMNED